MDQFVLIFLVSLIGLLLGRISFFGMRFGLAGILLVGLVFGHFGFEANSFATGFGLLLFVTGVGFSAGPIFINNFKNKAFPYIVIAIVTIVFSMLLVWVIAPIIDIPTPLLLGVLTGALTSTPGLGAAIETTQSNLASVGYGIAYPFGVIGVIIFINLTISFLKVDPRKEAEAFVNTIKRKQESESRLPKFNVDPQGFFPFFLAMAVGVLLGKVIVPLPGGAELSLGNAGGALISGLIFGHIGKIGGLSLKFSDKNARLLSDFGLVLFYVGTGVNAGSGALKVLKEYGLLLFFTGAVITLLSALVAYLVGQILFKLNIIDLLGAVTGAMTSTPGLGTLIDATGNPSVAASYASTYPLALLLVVISIQLLNIFL